MKLELPKVALEPTDTSPLQRLLCEAFRAVNVGGVVPPTDSPQPSRADRESETWAHYQTLSAELQSAAEKLAQAAFVQGIAYATSQAKKPISQAFGACSWALDALKEAEGAPAAHQAQLDDPGARYGMIIRNHRVYLFWCHPCTPEKLQFYRDAGIDAIEHLESIHVHVEDVHKANQADYMFSTTQKVPCAPL